ncbi:MAG: hypothetical protein K9L74_04735 [Candidatus Izimaplasma sp.]|nr:hypothetical protein [Candidatus Izimaplasma bacterium]
MMNILLTNDDGYKSEKLKLTKDVLKEYGKVYVVAPKKEQSGKGMALTTGGFNYKQVSDDVYYVDGTPVDSVNYAVLGLEIPFDLVVSGTNNGYNIGIDTRYSGTVGATLQAQLLDIPSIALSSQRNKFEILKQELKNTLDYIFDEKLLSKNYTLNVNFPRDSFKTSKGILETTLDIQNYGFTPTKKADFFHPGRHYIKKYASDKTDTFAYLNGYTSISKVKLQ